MVGAKQMRDILRAAERQDARLALVGDVVQLGSVEAGRAFGQLQQAGMPTLVLDEIVRQTRETQKAAVEASIRADAAAALHNIERGGGQVIEIGEQEGRGRDEALEQRHRVLAEHYAALSPVERHGAIVIDPSREGRHALNEAIRDRLVAKGELRGPEMRAEILEKKGLTKVEAKLALSYQPGDIVRFMRAYAPREQPTITKGDALEVVDVRPETGQVTLHKGDGRQIIWEPKQWGAKSEAFVPRARTLMAGDFIAWTGKTPGLDAIKGRLERVAAVDPRRNIAVIGRDRHRTIEVDLTRHKHWDHGYVTTAYQAQSRTAERVLAHLESWRVNLVNLRSFYVALSRAKAQVIVATDDRSALIGAIRERSGEKMAALDGLAREAGRTAEHSSRGAAGLSSIHRPLAAAKDRDRGHGLER
jgi:ATP-dependent exoDNAse (exonuclease V) alpha subunit